MKLKLSIASILLCFFCFGQQWNGLTYYSNSGSTTGRLIDTASATVKTFTFDVGTGYSTHMMPGGFVWRSCQNSNSLTGGGMTGRIQKWDYNNTKLWDYTYSTSTYCMHHDICPMPNGNVLIISYDVYTATQVAAAGGSFNGTMWSEKILELKPVGSNSAQVVWEWKVWDHLAQNTNSANANYVSSIVNNPQLLNINFQAQKDWMHMNGIDYNPVLDQISLSSHNLNEWYIIDHSTTTAEAASHSGGNAGKGGDFLYRWGNPPAYGASGTMILNVTHDAHWIPDGCPNAGYLAGINNKGVTSPSNKTCVDHIPTPRVDYNYTITPGSAYTPATFANRHISTGYTSNMGSCNQFPNGNQMVCLATSGSIYEINSAGTVLWSFSTGGTTAQSHRYTTCFINNAAPAQPSITLNGADLQSTSAASYQWYINGNSIPSATLQTYTPSQNGIYVVKVTDVNGCVYSVSAGYNHNFTPTGIIKNSVNENSVMVYPNPSNGLFDVSISNVDSKNLTIVVKDNLGKIIVKQTNTTLIDLSNYNNGLYFVTISSENAKPVTKKITLIK